MMAADYRHIGGVENRLGRHYSRFSPFSPTPALADQSLAWRKLWNAGSNRRSRASQLPPAKGVPKLGMILLPALRDPWGLDDPVPSVPSVHVQTSNGSPPIRPVATPFCKVGLGATAPVPPPEPSGRYRFGQ